MGWRCQPVGDHHGDRPGCWSGGFSGAVGLVGIGDAVAVKLAVAIEIVPTSRRPRPVADLLGISSGRCCLRRWCPGHRRTRRRRAPLLCWKCSPQLPVAARTRRGPLRYTDTPAVSGSGKSRAFLGCSQPNGMRSATAGRSTRRQLVLVLRRLAVHSLPRRSWRCVRFTVFSWTIRSRPQLFPGIPPPTRCTTSNAILLLWEDVIRFRDIDDDHQNALIDGVSLDGISFLCRQARRPHQRAIQK